MKTDKLTRAGGSLMLLLVAIFMLAPLVVVVLVSFSSSPVFNLPAPQWSLRWYQAVLHKDGLGQTLLLSVNVALASTAAALVLGTLCALAIAHGRFKGRDALLAFLVSPLLMPGLVIGVALLQLLRELGLRDVLSALIIGHIVITLPYVVRTVHASLALFDMRLLEAARTLGLSPARAVLKVMVPALAPAFLTSGLFAFLASMDNYPISIFLTDARQKTLPIEILRYLEESPDPTIAALSAGLILLAIIVLFITERLVGMRRLAQF
ncbi:MULTISPECIES: ABC transporter permease [unclassified Achromobacter]|uniref:ABC transporter permease n=1 Tax=unclassified Achromobacter TaxID=2626865 RepID=UPI000B51CF63|nr:MULTISPECIES: ABC transporter permease [unclassified Achromobacter]OWT79913.1 ABC transporter permease [Achromobacter sp. HZ34]OWT81797.1 ABC transporter permease [Achromobacter sp. HZ28]